MTKKFRPGDIIKYTGSGNTRIFKIINGLSSKVIRDDWGWYRCGDVVNHVHDEWPEGWEIDESSRIENILEKYE